MNTPHQEDILQRLSDAIDDPGGIPDALLAEAQAHPEAREFLAFWTGDNAQALAAPLPPCGIALREKILKLADQPAAFSPAVIGDPLPHATARWQSWFSGAAAAAIIFGCGWLLYQSPTPPADTVASNYKVTPLEIAAIERDIDKGVAAVAKPLSAVRMSLARLDQP